LPAVEDRALAEAMARQDPRGLDGAYRRYVNRLYTYCVALVPDPQAAADAVHSTFALAWQRASQLREPDRLRAWLYAIARRECLRLLPARKLEYTGERSAEPVEPIGAMQVAQVRELVQAALAGLDAADREMIQLTVRHGLSGAEAGAILGLAPNQAPARMSRARTRLLRALGVLLVARSGTRSCTELAGLVRGWDGTLTALVRKRLSRHIDGCPVCSPRQRQQLEPALLLPAYAGLPFLPAPDGLWPRVAGAGAAAVAERRFGPDGFPLRARSTLRRRRPLAAVAALLVLVTGTALLVPQLRPVDLTVAGPSVLPTPAPSAVASGGDGGGVSAAPSGVPPSHPSPSVPWHPPPSASGPAASYVVAAFMVSATGNARCDGSASFHLDVTATATANLDAARVFWTSPAGSGTTKDKAMTVAGSPAHARIDGLATSVRWWVEAESTDGQTASTAAVTVARDCP
jgi:RNA polymerase sigma factor (sigma-70 family)